MAIILAGGPAPAPSVAGTTLLALQRRIIEDAWPTQKPLLLTTSDAGDAGGTTVVVAELAYTSADANKHDGWWVHIEELETGGPAAGECSQVTAGGLDPTTGTLTVAPAFTAQVKTATNVALLPIQIDDVTHAINDIQRTLKMPRYLPLTNVTDGDMEKTGVTDWTDIGSPTTSAKTTDSGKVLFGQRAYHVVCDAVLEGVQTASVDVVEGRQMLVSTPVMVATLNVSVNLWDMTNNVSIGTAAGIDEREWTEVRFTATIPTDCTQVTLKYRSADTGDFYVGYSTIWPTAERLLTLPSQIADASDIEGVYYLPQGPSSTVANSYRMMDYGLEPWDGYEPWRDWRAVDAQRISIGACSYPLFLKFRSAGSTLSALTDTTDVPEEIILQGALAILNNKLAKRYQNTARAQEARDRNLSYQKMLADAGLARAVVRSNVQRRVSV